MSEQDNDDLMQTMRELLDTERAALLSGDIASIETLIPLKSELLKRLEGAKEIQGTEVSDLRAMAVRNHELLDEAMKGIRSVAERLVAMRLVRERLETYDAMGQKKSILSPRQSVERTA